MNIFSGTTNKVQQYKNEIRLNSFAQEEEHLCIDKSILKSINS